MPTGHQQGTVAPGVPLPDQLGDDRQELSCTTPEARSISSPGGALTINRYRGGCR